MATTYQVENMRVVFPTGKVAEKNPDRWATIHGTFYATKNDGKRGDKLSIAQKEITREMALSSDFAIDNSRGVLTIPSGQKGAPKREGATVDEIAAALAALRGEGTEEVSAETTTESAS